MMDERQSIEESEKLPMRNFKNLRISVDQQQQDEPCKCATYFNMESPVEHIPSCDNSPTTVINTSSDSCVYGTHYPNRIFVGHLPGKASATDLADFFRSFGTVLEGKVVLDSFGRSRRFGFVTFATHDDVQNVLKQENVFFKGKKINVGPAVKKMFGNDLTPPTSPTADKRSVSSSNGFSEDEETTAIITVPPVNERKEEVNPASPKIGNVWLKVSAKPRYVPKKPADKMLPASPIIYTQQVPYSPNYMYQTYYTYPVSQPYNFAQYYYTPQSGIPTVTPLYPAQCTQQVMNFQQWSQVNGYGSLQVA